MAKPEAVFRSRERPLKKLTQKVVNDKNKNGAINASEGKSASGQEHCERWKKKREQKHRERQKQKCASRRRRSASRRRRSASER